MSEASLSSWLRAQNQDAWEAMQKHRFVTDIEQDRLPEDAIRRYFYFEHAFVETAVLIFAHALLKAPGFAAQRKLIGTLHALAEDQLVWFQECFAALGIDAASDAPPLPEAVTRFADGMLAIAREGDYAAIVTIMLAAEWMYATWCMRAARKVISAPTLRAWVDLHAAPDFIQGADWLRAAVDGAGAQLSSSERLHLSSLFGRALILEIDFHSAAYDTTWPVPRIKEQA
jgi:thiaminase/transcriptional activator TenA